jgi:hypothetical protein
MKLLSVISVGFGVTYQLLIIFFLSCQILEKKWEYKETIHELFIDFKKSYDSIRSEKKKTPWYP